MVCPHVFAATNRSARNSRASSRSHAAIWPVMRVFFWGTSPTVHRITPAAPERAIGRASSLLFCFEGGSSFTVCRPLCVFLGTPARQCVLFLGSCDVAWRPGSHRGLKRACEGAKQERAPKCRLRRRHRTPSINDSHARQVECAWQTVSVFIPRDGPCGRGQRARAHPYQDANPEHLSKCLASAREG